MNGLLRTFYWCVSLSSPFFFLDVWSAGCVLAELLLGQPIFPGDSGVDQLVEIIKVWNFMCCFVCIIPWESAWKHALLQTCQHICVTIVQGVAFKQCSQHFSIFWELDELYLPLLQSCIMICHLLNYIKFFLSLKDCTFDVLGNSAYILSQYFFWCVIFILLKTGCSSFVACNSYLALKKCY